MYFSLLAANARQSKQKIKIMGKKNAIQPAMVSDDLHATVKRLATSAHNMSCVKTLPGVLKFFLQSLEQVFGISTKTAVNILEIDPLKEAMIDIASGKEYTTMLVSDDNIDTMNNQILQAILESRQNNNNADELKLMHIKKAGKG